MTDSAHVSQDSSGLRLDLPAAHSAVRMARELVREFAVSKGMNGRELETLILVASELLGNAVDHGGGESAMEESDLSRPVRMYLDMHVDEVSWSVGVADQGGGDPAVVDELLHPDGMPDLEDERGRGFFLLAEMVDELTVAPSPDGQGLLLRAVRRWGESDS